MYEKKSGKTRMSSVEVFAQDALRGYVAPASIGSVKERLRTAARRLGWSYHRTKSVWYGDERVRISGAELVQIEEATGLRYGRQELEDIDALIARAETLMEGADPDFHRPFVAALRAFFGAAHRTGIEE